MGNIPPACAFYPEFDGRYGGSAMRARDEHVIPLSVGRGGTFQMPIKCDF